MTEDESLLKLEQEAKQWSRYQVMKLKMEISKLSHKGKGELAKSLNSRVRKDKLGVLTSVSFGFVRHGVFFQKGVGRGYIMQGGKVVRGSKPNKEQAAYAKNKNRVIGKVITDGSINRHPADWFNTPINNNIPKLADLVAQYMADATVNATRMQIK